jgi:hypothetical protein
MFLGGGVILREDDVVIFYHLRFWAERGLIHIEDERDNSYDIVAVRVALHRARALSEMLMNSRREAHTHDQYDQNNKAYHQRFLERIADLVRKAQIQGMPSDPTARRDLVRRRPMSVVVPGYGGGM